MKFLHTADWQVGMRATQLGEKGERVRHARLESARRVIEEARRESFRQLFATYTCDRKPGTIAGSSWRSQFGASGSSLLTLIVL